MTNNYHNIRRFAFLNENREAGIEKQTAAVTRTKKRYDEELDKLNTLLEKKKEIESRELLEAYSRSHRTYKEVMAFLTSE